MSSSGSSGGRTAEMQRGGLLGYFVRHRTAANLLVVLMLAAGLLSLPKIRSQFFPDVVIEAATVTVAWRGAGPEDVNRAVVSVLEPALLTVAGVEKVRSIAREGAGIVTVEFEAGTEMGPAMDAVKAVVDGIRTLPDEAEAPVIRRVEWRDLVTDVVIAGPVGTESLALYADELVGRLFREGVTRTTVRGIADPEIAVEPTEARMLAEGVTLRDIAAAIEAHAAADPAGDVDGVAARLRTGVERRTVEEIGGIVLRQNADGSRLLIRDVAAVSLSGPGTRVAYLVGRHPAVTIRVDRAEADDAIAVLAKVRRVAQEMGATLPEGVTVELVRSRAAAISDRLDLLIDNGIAGLVLVLVILFVMLDARTAFWVAAGIPTSLLAAVAILYLAGFTLNMVSLFALILSLGIVVDDAIVVGEYADQLHRNRGYGPERAALAAAHRMAAPVLASSLTTIIAFGALMVIGGRMGTLVADIPFTIAVVLFASLLECFLALPAHMRHSLAAGAKRAWYDWPSLLFNRGFAWFLDRLFRPFCRLVLALRYPVIGAMLLGLSLAVSDLVSGRTGFVFFSAPEEGSVSGSFAMAPGTDRAATAAMLAELQRAVAAVAAAYEAEDGRNPLRFVMGQIGGTAGSGLADEGAKDTDELGGILIELVSPDERPWSSGDFVARLEAEVRRHPLLETLSFRSGRFGPAANGLEVRLSGGDARGLKAAAEDLKARLAAFPVATGVEDDLAWDKTELVLELTPRGRALGFTIDALGTELYQRLTGITAAEFAVGLRTATVRVRLAEGEIRPDFFQRVRVRSPSGAFVPLQDIATVTPEQGFSTIRRENGIQIVTVTGDVADGDPDAHAAFRTALETEILPGIAARHAVAWELGGLVEQEREFLSDATLGLLVAITGIYACLAWVLASWTRPVMVLLIVPFGLAGAVWGHQVWDLPLSMFSVVGLIGMTGIIINDSIVLITTIDEYARRRALPVAVVEATVDRLRPVLLTTLTTVLGMAPLLYEPSVQAQFLKPTVITLVYGLGFGVIIVLLLVPATIGVQHDVAMLLAALRRGFGRRARRAPGLRRLLLAGAGGTALAVAAGFGTAQLAASPLPFLPPAAAGIAVLAAGTALALGLVRAAARRRGRDPRPEGPSPAALPGE